MRTFSIEDAQKTPMASIPTEGAFYHPSILHDPVDVDPDGPVARVISLLRRKLKIAIKDDRVFLGTFTAYDKFGNFVLTDTEEFFRDQIRKIPMVIVPLDYVTAIEAESTPPGEKPNE
jgi:small nuclear ribonucleoprotein (snRNP)-like protein